MSNFFHGTFLLLFVAFAPGLIHWIPLAALAAMLTFTGTRLASPKGFAKTLRIGREQLVIFVTTAATCIVSDLLVGVAVKLLIHLTNGAPLRVLFRSEVDERVEEGRVVLPVKHAAIFSNYLSIQRKIENHAHVSNIEIDFANARLVDHTVMSNLHELQGVMERNGRKLTLAGLGDHSQMSSHPLSVRKRPVISPVAER
ncbi:SulP family inorganic anion transporter [Sorangium sp. So ce367]|uniref:SulP family inorganic anion transporter n=1 Tax=Sorangium sp. So ce367 TaxID=3133305 RepID=UPI003F5DD098